jgi:hypothetical protein
MSGRIKVKVFAVVLSQDSTGHLVWHGRDSSMSPALYPAGAQALVEKAAHDGLSVLGS